MLVMQKMFPFDDVIMQHAGWHVTMRQMISGVISPELKILQIGKYAGSILRNMPEEMLIVKFM